MLLLINEQKNCAHILQDYSGLYNHIESHEKQRYARKGSHHKSQPWVFTRHSYQRMVTYQDTLARQATMGHP